MNQEFEKSGPLETIKSVLMIVVFVISFVVIAQGILLHEKQKSKETASQLQ